MKINAVAFMYVESCYKSLTSKYQKSNSDINISKIYRLPFDMLCFSLEKMTTLFQMHRQSKNILKRLVVRNYANGTTI